MGQRSALIAAQDHALIRMVFIVGQAEHTVDVVDILTQAEILQRQVLNTGPDISDRCQDSWSSRRNVP
jgi:hypothetical protein